MKTAVIRAFGLFASVLVAGVASAQSTQAVEWKVSDGGNGHWYWWYSTDGNWAAGQAAASLAGAQLVTITSQAENDFIHLRVANRSYGTWWTGGVCDGLAWRWLTGESWVYENWGSSPMPLGEGLKLVFNSATGKWEAHESPWSPISSIFEWSADCNGDGIVDYGQLRRGELADLNTNNIPDVCEVSVSGVTPPSVPAQGGSTVTIRGTNFQGTPKVLIGGVPATNVVTVSPISLTATSPALPPGMVSVTVNGFTLQDAIYIRPECGSDLDQDGEVTAADIAIVLLDFGPCYASVLAPESDSSIPFMIREDPAPAAPQSR